MSEIRIEDFYGKSYKLTGVSTDKRSATLFPGNFKDASFMNFVLDGVIYCAIEDPSDGYRSCLADIAVVADVRMTNSFDPCLVVGRPGSTAADRTVEFVDEATGAVVLEIGTRNTDDYYPCFVSNFRPENMTSNAEKKAINELQSQREAQGWGSF